MRHYHENSIYDDPFSFCDTRYKIAGQWYGLPKAFKSLNPRAHEVVANEKDEIVFKLRQEYTFKLVNITKVVDSLITLKLDPDEVRLSRYLLIRYADISFNFADT